MSRIAKDFGMKVKFFRTQKDMSQEKLAELCGRQIFSYAERYESGKACRIMRTSSYIYRTS